MAYMKSNPFDAVRQLWDPPKPPIIPQALLDYRVSHNKARSFEDDDTFLYPPLILKKDRAFSAPNSRTLMPPPPIPSPRKPACATPPREPKKMHIECTPPRHSFTVTDRQGNVVPISRQVTPPHFPPYTLPQHPYQTWLMGPPIPQYNGVDPRYAIPAQNHFDSALTNEQQAMQTVAPMALQNLAWPTNSSPAAAHYAQGYNYPWSQHGFPGQYPWGTSGGWGIPMPYQHQAAVAEESGETEAEEVVDMPTRLRWDKNSVPFIPGAMELAEEVRTSQEMEKLVDDLTLSPRLPEELIAIDSPVLAPKEEDSGLRVVLRGKKKERRALDPLADRFRVVSEDFPPLKNDLKVGDVAILKHQVEGRDVKTMGEKRWGSV